MSASTPSLEQLRQAEDFASRHIGPNDAEIASMLGTLGLDSLDALIERAVPEAIRTTERLGLPGGRTEQDVLGELREMADANEIRKSLIGLGYHGCITPNVILRNVLENPGWYTAYTPYQPEISQGRLEALLNFQTMVMDLTAMEIANASLLDEATAAAEAMAMCRHVNRAESDTFFVAADCLAQTIAVVRTRARPLGIEVIVGDAARDLGAGPVFGGLVQYPSRTGAIGDPGAAVEAIHAAGGLAVVASDPLALILLTPPGELGADVVVGSSQRFGVPLGFGGPHAAFFATRDAYKRAMPGRLVGQSVDARGRPAYRLALQTREQHIRREKATSNICTAQVLLAVMASMYAVYHGPERLRTIARRVHRLAAVFAEGLRQQGRTIVNESFFDTLTIAVPGEADAILERAGAAGYNLRRDDADTLGVSFDETVGVAELARLWAAFGGPGAAALSPRDIEAAAANGVPEPMRRTSAFLTHPVFNSAHSETEMMRYLRRLQEKDVALDRSMIPLGSCTMKLNAAVEMIPVTWPGFAAVHPFVPPEQARGYRRLVDGLEEMLERITGFAAVSLQPNAGSQGEFAGLLAIRAYHRSRGEGDRGLCLIPSSAHGTNPASAVMAGCAVAMVECDDRGNVDVDDLRAKAERHASELAALMVTYPSTHGVFEERIGEVCDIIHRYGGQVYMDGANLNALVGVCRPAELGPDVMHINLHKTFCIPHGGGGPGVGPIGVKAHLAPFLPSHPLPSHPVNAEAGPPGGVGPIAAAPWGSAGILPISWAYIALMGEDGLRRATEVAILNANYIAHRLAAHYPVLYTGPGGLVAHECIIDTRPLQAEAGITVEDIAKRLMDYGFHAPTMSWPVASTLMIEPTESESKKELDRFCAAMIGIRKEIARVERGEWERDDNPLKNAPHSIDDIAADDWTHPYSREEAAFPVPDLRREKYWPPVSRIDQAHGDRHLVCARPPLDSYRDAAE